MLNSVMLALTDYTCVDMTTGKPGTSCSWRNALVEETEIYFTIAFSLECVIKIISTGFCLGENTYLTDPWNVMDFVVVVSGLISLIPNLSAKFSAIRTVRILRPLRSLSALPGLRLLVVSLLSSISALLNVILLLAVIFAIFGILGVQLWAGAFHFRCRLTPFPVMLEAPGAFPPSPVYLERVLAKPDAYRCQQDTGADASWENPKDCFWPLDEDNLRLCTSGTGGYTCPSETSCGSNWDKDGRPRFIDVTANNSPLYLMDSALDNADLNYGYTTFDHMGMAFVTMFQSITMEGWTIIMYMVEDSYSNLAAWVLFCFLILFVSFFLLNLTLAVIWEEFDKNAQKFSTENEALEFQQSRRGAVEEKLGLWRRVIRFMRADLDEASTQPGCGGQVMLDFVTHRFFNVIVIAMIVLNTALLAMDHHAMDASFEANLEVGNFVLSLVFALEMLVKIAGFGLVVYVHDLFNVFDAFIVVVSIIELLLLPPMFLGGEPGEGGGALSALRTFRLFRVFKLARNWHALQALLKTIMKTLGDVGNFAILLFLFMYIYALVGMQLFANQLMFHPETGRSIDFRHELFNRYVSWMKIFMY